jgi:hypothetical protein
LTFTISPQWPLDRIDRSARCPDGIAQAFFMDHVLVLDERHLRRILTRYFAYYHRARTHYPDGRENATAAA